MVVVGASGFAAFVDADNAPEARNLLCFLDAADSLPVIAEARQRSIEHLHPSPGNRILDVGCGTGSFARLLAAKAPTVAEIVGIDHSRVLLEVARKRTPTIAIAPSIDYVHGSADRLNFNDAQFDGVHAERVFMYLPHPDQAFAELVRVTRPGGRIVLFEPDMEGWMIDAPDREATRRIMNSWCDGIPNGWIGRRLPGLFDSAGLRDVRVEPMTLVVRDFATVYYTFLLNRVVDQVVRSRAMPLAQASAWLDSLQDSDKEGRFFFATTNLLVSGVKA